jgi:hypothetical protein
VEAGGLLVPADVDKVSQTQSQKQNKRKRAGDMAQGAERLPGKGEALILSPAGQNLKNCLKSHSCFSEVS